MKRFALCLAIALIGACAGRANPVIDPAGVDMGRYQQDLGECEQIAQQVEQKAGERALGGALVVGLIGSVVGDSNTAKKAAGAGLIAGGARGAGETRRERAKVVKNCLRNRGYAVLN